MCVSPRLCLSTIEPLEARIAPALLVYGANLLGGSDNPSTGEASIGSTDVTLVKVLSGKAVVWYDGNDITGISFGPGASLDITGDIDGDIVGNLTADGLLSDSDGLASTGEDGGELLANNLAGLTIRSLGTQEGNVGNVLTGGTISNVKISGRVAGIYAGDGVFRMESEIGTTGTVTLDVKIDVNPVQPGVLTTFTLAKTDASFTAGAGVANVAIGTAKSLQLFAGNGDPTGTGSAAAAGKAGGSVSNVKIDTAFIEAGGGATSYSIIAGDGGAGSTGGAGGSVRHVIEAQSAVQAEVTAGDGGAGLTGRGGAGGSATQLDLQGDNTSYSVTAGNGGTGAPGGAGGSIQSSNFAGKNPSTAIVITGDFDGDDVDDVIVIDSGTGKFVLSINSGDGSTFTPQNQHIAPEAQLVASLGATPIDAAASDLDGDGDLDLVVAYANSSSLGLYFNDAKFDDGTGVFYGPGDVLNGTTFDLGITPERIAVGKFADTATPDVAVFSTFGGNSSVSVFVGAVDGMGAFSLSRLPGQTLLDGVPTDLVVTDEPVGADRIYIAMGASLATLAPGNPGPAGPFRVIEHDIIIDGGVVSLDLDFENDRLVVLSGGGAAPQSLYAITIKSVAVLETESITPLTLEKPGQVLDARFIYDADHERFDDVVVLQTLANARGTVLQRYTSGITTDELGKEVQTYSPADALETSTVLKTLAIVNQELTTTFDSRNEHLTQGFALIGTATTRFSFAPASFASIETTELPFAPKTVNLLAGNGGNGLDLGTKIGAGGDGGAIRTVNLQSGTGLLAAGDGGDSMKGAAGAGGSVSNAATFVSASGQLITPVFKVDKGISIFGGDGGSATGVAVRTAHGGAGGAVTNLSIDSISGQIVLTGGDGGVGSSGKGGAGGKIASMEIEADDSDLLATAGSGGASGSGAFAGGKGGEIAKVTFLLNRPIEFEKAAGHPGIVSFKAGDGGSSVGGAGGAGGGASGLTLTVDGAPVAGNDTTITISITGGNGANGTIGGAGGGIKTVRTESIHDDLTDSGTPILSRVVLKMTGGNGGNGSAGNGGDGGAIALSGKSNLNGITFYDDDSDVFDPMSPDFDPTPYPLAIYGGDAGAGSVRGGTGGSISGVVAQNSLFDVLSQSPSFITGTHLQAALLKAGAGGNGGSGDGGKGGDVTKARIGVEGGPLYIYAGNAGAGGTTGGAAAAKAKGGNGGSVSKSLLGSVGTGAFVALYVEGGDAGPGVAAGGLGGGLTSLEINAPAREAFRSAELIAGHGGNASAANGVGGKGGSIASITQSKDLNASLDLLLAGNGGNAPAKGGDGGDVRGIRVAGYIGKPSATTIVLPGAAADPLDPLPPSIDEKLGVFERILIDTDNDPMTPPDVSAIFVQGLFSGRGGTGTTAGINGAVADVTARGIAAIAAAPSAITSTGTPILFAAASSVTKVTARIIGYDIGVVGAFDSTGVPGPGNSPTVSQPIDGFILAQALVKVTGNLAAFTNPV